MKKHILLVCILMIGMFLYPKNSFALKCVDLESGEKAYNKYDGIIEAQVEKVTRKKENNRLQLKVIRSFKEITETSLSVTEDMTWGSLDGPGEKGETYLFYLKKSNGQWENPLCSPSMKIADAGEELKYLGAKEISLKDTEETEGTAGKVGEQESAGSEITESTGVTTGGNGEIQQVGNVSNGGSKTIFGMSSWIVISIVIAGILLSLLLFGILRKRRNK